jgi:hypothetical protein
MQLFHGWQSREHLSSSHHILLPSLAGFLRNVEHQDEPCDRYGPDKSLWNSLHFMVHAAVDYALNARHFRGVSETLSDDKIRAVAALLSDSSFVMSVEVKDMVSAWEETRRDSEKSLLSGYEAYKALLKFVSEPPQSKSAAAPTVIDEQVSSSNGPSTRIEASEDVTSKRFRALISEAISIVQSELELSKKILPKIAGDVKKGVLGWNARRSCWFLRGGSSRHPCGVRRKLAS